MCPRIHFALVALLGVLVLRCANGYQQFYTDLMRGQSIALSKYLIANFEQPQVFRGTDPDVDAVAMAENGYWLIGYSNFNGPISSQNDPAAQARAVHAAVVLVYGKFSHSVAGSIPYTVYTPGTVVTTNSNGSIYDSTGGSANYSGTTYTYLPGYSTTYQSPYRIDRYDQAASFWVKTKRQRLGIIQRDLTEEQRQRYQRNRGIVAFAVVKGSPAFMADILRGDVVIRIGSDDVIDAATYIPLIDKYQGQDVDVVWLRAGEQHSKIIHINQAE
jgi:hypothetical protein